MPVVVSLHFKFRIIFFPVSWYFTSDTYKYIHIHTNWSPPNSLELEYVERHATAQVKVRVSEGREFKNWSTSPFFRWINYMTQCILCAYVSIRLFLFWRCENALRQIDITYIYIWKKKSKKRRQANISRLMIGTGMSYNSCYISFVFIAYHPTQKKNTRRKKQQFRKIVTVNVVMLCVSVSNILSSKWECKHQKTHKKYRTTHLQAVQWCTNI